MGPIRRTNESVESQGFILLELVLVTVLAVVLAVLVVSSAGTIAPSAASSTYRTNVTAVESALEAYKAESGRYPDPGPAGQAELTGAKGFLSAWPSSPSCAIALDPVVPGQLDVTQSGRHLVIPAGS